MEKYVKKQFEDNENDLKKKHLRMNGNVFVHVMINVFGGHVMTKIITGWKR